MEIQAPKETPPIQQTLASRLKVWSQSSAEAVSGEARLEGVDSDCLAQACLFAALTEFVTTYGEEATANLANGLSDRIRNGEFSIERARQ